jgi:hypothetical protein
MFHRLVSLAALRHALRLDPFVSSAGFFTDQNILIATCAQEVNEGEECVPSVRLVACVIIETAELILTTFDIGAFCTKSYCADIKFRSYRSSIALAA